MVEVLTIVNGEDSKLKFTQTFSSLLIFEFSHSLHSYEFYNNNRTCKKPLIWARNISQKFGCDLAVLMIFASGKLLLARSKDVVKGKCGARTFEVGALGTGVSN